MPAQRSRSLGAASLPLHIGLPALPFPLRLSNALLGPKPLSRLGQDGASIGLGFLFLVLLDCGGERSFPPSSPPTGDLAVFYIASRAHEGFSRKTEHPWDTGFGGVPGREEWSCVGVLSCALLVCRAFPCLGFGTPPIVGLSSRLPLGGKSSPDIIDYVFA